MKDGPPQLSNKKKHKKEKRKHKKHSSDKVEKDKSKKHKKHKKSKHRDGEKIEKNGDYTPEKKESTVVIPNGKVSEAKQDSDTTAKFIAEGLEMDKNKIAADIVSSESDVQDADCDSVDIDLELIEADMDLEELMKQKELLQAQLAKAESEGIVTPHGIAIGEKVTEEVILLDDSDESEHVLPQTIKRKRSKSRERKILIKPREDSKKRRTHSRERVYREHERDRQISK